MDATEAEWLRLLEDTDLRPKVREMIAAAGEHAALRRLFPYLSLAKKLQFSVTTDYPYSDGLPSIGYVDPEGVLDGPGYDVRDREFRPTRFADLALAIRFLVDLLPPGC